MPHKNHPKHLQYFIVYTFNYIALGAAISVFGPMIPYMAQASNKIQTQFSSLFLFRSLGMVTGAFIKKGVQTHFSQINLMIIGCIGLGVFLTLFGFTQGIGFWAQLYMFLGHIFFIFNDILINSGVMIIYSQKQIQKWISSIHGMFGVGALLGPVFVWLFQLYTPIFLGFFLFCIIPIYCKLTSPQHLVFPQQILSSPQKQPPPTQYKDGLSITHLRLLCSLFFLYVGMECAYGGWISSYAVLNQIATKSSATKFSTIFFTSFTVWRFILPHFTLTTTKKLLILQGTAIATSLLSLAFVAHRAIFAACIFSGVMLGFSLSVNYPLLMTIPHDYGFKLSTQQTTTVFLFAALGEGVLSMLIGYLMEVFGEYIFFYGILFMQFTFTAITLKLLYNFMQEKQQHQSIQMGNKSKQVQ